MVETSTILGIAESYAYKIIYSIIILLIGLIVGILAKKFTYRLLKEIELNTILKVIGIRADLEKWISSIISYIIYYMTIIASLHQLQIVPIYILYLIAGGILTLLILTFIVGVKDIIPNFIAWMILQKKQHIKVGMEIEIKEIAGEIEKIGCLETEIRTKHDDLLYIPNSLFLKSKFKIKRNNKQTSQN